MLVRVEISTDDNYSTGRQKRVLMRRLLAMVADFSNELSCGITRVAIIEPPKPKKKKS